MSDETQTHDEPDGTNSVWSRTTAPQSQYTTTQVTIGLIVLVIGLLVVFGIPVALT